MSLRAIIISASSDIGRDLAIEWKKKGWDVWGTYRSHSESLKLLADQSIPMVRCDLSDDKSIDMACCDLPKDWEILVFCAGLMDPIGTFESVDFKEWENGLNINFISQLRMLHKLLPSRNKNSDARVLFFAGGGTNNAVTNYSSYCISKIALIKMCELLDAEIPDVWFMILGPGWVKTKIHESTIAAGPVKAGSNYQKTQMRLDGDEWISMDRVIESCTWLATTQSRGVRGRNFSVANDRIGSKQLEDALEENPNMYKLRRDNNFWGTII